MEIGKMRRRDREIKDQNEVIDILKRNQICHLAMCADDQPYVIPMIFGYEDGIIYMHCAEVGTKLDFLRKNNNVCFEVQGSTPQNLIENAGMPCDWAFAFESAIGFGKAELIDDREEKIKAYNTIISKMHPEGYVHDDNNYTEKKIKGSYVIKIKIDKLSGKRFDGHKPIPSK